MRGGTFSCRQLRKGQSGLSPRARGNLLLAEKRHAVPRSIPACAGEPSRAASRRPCSAVYPRVRGGTKPDCRICQRLKGLSPRARGNLVYLTSGTSWTGSIPACAGEPPAPAPSPRPGRVYPRVRGGTTPRNSWGFKGTGLSPRARGNLPKVALHEPLMRSIPACAGEPQVAVDHVCDRQVYPRVRGGTAQGTWTKLAYEGLSPRARGNPVITYSEAKNQGSIPACAGEPHERTLHTPKHTVYPRVRGGTYCWRKSGMRLRGLSPRARGNQRRGAMNLSAERSIPACAGEPSPTKSPSRPCRVYPRVRGGTSVHRASRKRGKGLSPRARGNHRSRSFFFQ